MRCSSTVVLYREFRCVSNETQLCTACVQVMNADIIMKNTKCSFNRIQREYSFESYFDGDDQNNAILAPLIVCNDPGRIVSGFL